MPPDSSSLLEASSTWVRPSSTRVSVNLYAKFAPAIEAKYREGWSAKEFTDAMILNGWWKAKERQKLYTAVARRMSKLRRAS